MKKKISIMFFLLAAIKSLLGAPPYSELNSMIYESLMDYITIFDIANNKGYRYEPSLRKSQHRKCRLMSKDFFICSDGMPQDFPYDRIQVEKLSLEFMEGNPYYIKKKLHTFKTVLIVKYYLYENCIEIKIHYEFVRRAKKHHTIHVVSGEDTKHYYYKYNHDNNKWERCEKNFAWITDSTGVAVQHLCYLPWGEPFVTQKTGNFNPTYTFSGKERDEETGYSYFGQRFYDSELSLWISVDPLRIKYPSFTPFNYCANNPIRLVDPNGEEIDLSQMDEGQRIRLIEALSYITGLKLSVDSEGLLHYANITGEEEGSASARNDLISAIDKKKENGDPYRIVVNSSIESKGGQNENGDGGGIRLSVLYPEEEDFSTNGMGIGFMHELRHAAFGDKDPIDQSTGASYIKMDGLGYVPKTGNNLGSAATRVNTYRDELNMPLRLAYPQNPRDKTIPFGNKNCTDIIWRKMY